jgi:hypothetical protein
LFFNASWLDSETQIQRRSIPKINVCQRQISPCLFRNDRLLSLHVPHMTRAFYYGNFTHWIFHCKNVSRPLRLNCFSPCEYW